jgi:hypothetical protein
MDTLRAPNRFQLFNLTIESDLDLHSPMAVAGGPADLHIRRAQRPWPHDAPLLAMDFRIPAGSVQYQICRGGDRIVLRFDPFASFSISSDTIEYYQQDGSPDSLFWLLTGAVLGFWLETAGWPVLHGATVEIDGQAVVFLGDSGGGKTTMAAGFLREGYGLLGDDHVVLERAGTGCAIRPALPWLKVRSDVAQYLGVDHATLPRLHPTFAKHRLDLTGRGHVSRSVPLSRIYLLQREGRRAGDVCFDRLSSQPALMELLRHSYAPRSVAAAGIDRQRLRLLAEVVSRAGVWRLRYPHGLHSLSAIPDAVIAHLREASAS